MNKKYDALIIGTGQAGPTLASRMAADGLETAIIERNRFGGTCVNVGCTPTKTMVASARAAYVARRAAEFGVVIDGPVRVDMKRVKLRKDDVVRRSNEGVEKWLKNTKNLTVYEGHARFEGPHEVRVGDDLLTAERIFINVGTRPSVPEMPGLTDVNILTSSDMVDIDYDLHRVRLLESANPYQRFRDLLPVKDPALLPADAHYTPTLHARKLGAEIGMPHLYLKNETVLPSGSTKDRMAAVALAYLWECGVRSFCTSSTGNSSTAYARAITNFPGFTMFLSSASDFHQRVQFPATEQVVHLVLRDATFVDAFHFAGNFAEEHGFVSERGFFNPGRREGLKLAFMEATEQVPQPIDWYVQAVSSAMGVFGTSKAAQQLHGLGRIPRLPRLLCVQQESCSPMVHAWNEGSETIQPHHIVANPTGIAKAILRGNPTGAYPRMRRIVRESDGAFAAVSEQEIREARRMVEQLEDISPCFSASTALAGLIKRARNGELSRDETVLVNLTGRDREPSGEAPPAHWLHRKDDGWIPEDPTDPVLQALWRK